MPGFDLGGSQGPEGSEARSELVIAEEQVGQEEHAPTLFWEVVVVRFEEDPDEVRPGRDVV